MTNLELFAGPFKAINFCHEGLQTADLNIAGCRYWEGGGRGVRVWQRMSTKGWCGRSHDGRSGNMRMNLLFDAPVPRRIASLPVASIVATIADGGANND